MKKQNKDSYLTILQGNYGYGWDDIEYFDLHNSTVKERKLASSEYVKNMPCYSYRWVTRRELNK